MTPEEKLKALLNFATKLKDSQVSLPDLCSQAVDEDFWELMSDN